MKVLRRAILPRGFEANGIACGIKKSGNLDLALLYSNIAAKAACQFTTNKILAAPLIVDKRCLKINKEFRAVIVNSGNANCFTGRSGIKDAEETSKELARVLKIKKEAVLLSSTGIIGRRLPLAKIKKNIGKLSQGLSSSGIDKAKVAIMTTDTFAKEISLKFKIAGRQATLCGIAKGAGMIAPNMATMLAFLLTDANISQLALQQALKICVAESFNCITIDGCMSTNDSVILLANGAAKNKLIAAGKDFNQFVDALRIACLELAKMIVRDAEGATKFITLEISGAKNLREAKQAGQYIANSNLFKTAMYGQNHNFGRIVAAVGASGIEVREEDLRIKVSSLAKKDILVKVNLSRGKSGCRVYTCDLTPQYIKINAEYN